MSQAPSPNLRLYQRISALPFGNDLFACAVCLKAPYFGSIRPRILEFRPGYIKTAMRKRRAVTNHLGTVHAIASCNLCEFTAGVMLDLSRPAQARWIPAGMQVRYLRKAETDLTAVCELPDDIDWQVKQSLPLAVGVFDAEGAEVVHADIEMHISPLPQRS